MAFEKRLGKMAETWSNSREEKGGFNEAFEDGVHTFQLQRLALQESGSSGQLMAVAEHYCCEGEQAGEVYVQFFNLEKTNDEGKVWGQVFLAQLIEKLGYETPEDVSNLEETLAEIEEAAPKYTARVRTNKQGYKNITIVQVLEEKAEPEFNRDGDKDEKSEKKSSKKPSKEEEGNEEEKTEEEEGDEKEVDEGEESGDDEDEDLEALKEFAEAWSVSVDDDVSMKKLVSTLKEYDWEEDKLTEDEVKLLKKHGITIKTTPKEKPKAKAAPAKKSKKGK